MYHEWPRVRNGSCATFLPPVQDLLRGFKWKLPISWLFLSSWCSLAKDCLKILKLSSWPQLLTKKPQASPPPPATTAPPCPPPPATTNLPPPLPPIVMAGVPQRGYRQPHLFEQNTAAIICWEKHRKSHPLRRLDYYSPELVWGADPFLWTCFGVWTHCARIISIGNITASFLANRILLEVAGI